MKTIKIEKTEDTFFLPAHDVLAVWNATSKEQARYYLGGVFVEESDTLQLVATDGAVLLRKECDDMAFIGENVTTQQTDTDRGFILRIDPTDKAMKARTRKDAWIYGDIATGIAQVVDFDHDLGVEQVRVGVLEFDRVDGTFPDWRRIMPKSGDAYVPVNVDLDKLTVFQKAAKMFTKFSVVSISAHGEGEPMVVKFKGVPSMTGVVMPMRM